MFDLFRPKSKKIQENITLESSKEKDIPVIPVSLSPNQFEKLELEKRRELIRNSSLLIIIVQLADSAIKVVAGQERQWNNWVFDIPIVVLGFYIRYLLKTNSLRIAAWIAVLIYFCSVINNYLQYGTDVPLIIGFMIPILLGAALLNKWEVLIISTLSFGFTIGLYICQDGLKIFRPPLLDAKSHLIYFTIPLLLALLPTTWFVLLSYIHDRSRRFQLQREWWQVTLNEISQKNQQITTALAELQLQRERELDLHRAVIRAGERERVSLARNLHDDPLQQFQELSRQLGQLTRTNPQLLKLQENTRQTAKKLRAICRNLRPDILEKIGLYEALLDLTGELEQNGLTSQTQLRLNVARVLQEARFSAELEIIIYRIAQEAIHNALKHAQATTITIDLSYQAESKIALSIKDDGKGFELPSDLRNLAIQGHYGLIGFFERTAQHVGGELHVFSSPQTGTTIQLSLPATAILEDNNLFSISAGGAL